MRPVTIFLSCLVALATCATATQAMATNSWGVQWKQVSKAAILSGHLPPNWYCGCATDPAIALDDQGRLVVWFTTIGVDKIQNKLSVNGMNIGRAVLNRDYEATLDPDRPILSSSNRTNRWDNKVETVSVLRNPDRSAWRLYYLGYAGSTGATYSNQRFKHPAIGEMQSRDREGKLWGQSRQIYVPKNDGWDNQLVTGPSALIGPDGIWRVYFFGLGAKGVGLGLLTSKDGVQWTPYSGNPIFAGGTGGAWDQTILEGCVRFYRGKYWLWYSGWSGPLRPNTSISIGLALSDDGIHWTRYTHNPILSPNQSGWPTLSVLAPDVVQQADGSLVMAAYGRNKTDAANIPGVTGIWISK
jgi:hypothetical protein